MADDQPRHTLADYLVIVISPVLIMALVGSLVFFLVEVLYVGQYDFRMRWILFFFVFGAVLVARITMQNDIAGRAGIYGLILGGLTWFALQTYVDYQPTGVLAGWGWAVNLILLALVWWCVHRLTWDCTYIDDHIDASGAGLLEAAGLDTPTENPAEPVPAQPETKGKKTRAKAKETGILAWWDRYRRYREERRKQPHTPGVWVVYFSLAALPLFGLGEARIPASAEATRRYVFGLMVLYVGSGLGLLLSTSFLGLRRYLRQRGVQMPLSMTAVWVTTGSILIAALLALGTILPRPYPEYSLLNPSKLPSAPDREASRLAPMTDSPGKSDGRASSEQAPDEEKGAPADVKTRTGAGKDGRKSGGDSGKGKSPSSKDKDTHAKGDSSTEKKQPPPSNQSKEAGKGSNSTAPAKQTGETRKDAGGTAQNPSASSQFDSMPRLPTWLATALKWLVYALLAIAGLYVVARLSWSFLKYMSHFTDWVRRLLQALENWWQGWGTQRGRKQREEESYREAGASPRPFASYRNPFAHGGAPEDPEEVVRYSFEALLAFARERGLERSPEETPLEFTERLVGEIPALEADARNLTALYARAAYAGGHLPVSSLAPLRQFWHSLEATHEQPLST